MYRGKLIDFLIAIKAVSVEIRVLFVLSVFYHD